MAMVELIEACRFEVTIWSLEEWNLVLGISSKKLSWRDFLEESNLCYKMIYKAIHQSQPKGNHKSHKKRSRDLVDCSRTMLGIVPYCQSSGARLARRVQPNQQFTLGEERRLSLQLVKSPKKSTKESIYPRESLPKRVFSKNSSPKFSKDPL